ncbi:hypothetical protein [Corynebacterium mastitidis]|uniref:hypothetical protein n=1 Tax=Corynebacterium mastitidis TaxID=161890 RepID=UPI00254B7D10|nr:hypothetical protein [Corynebacterium mastitidis]MDK8450959.1 hypothetical protein [Corynebacterium mastitidis]
MSTTKVEKLNIDATDTGIGLDVDGAGEGIHIEYEILPTVMQEIVKAALRGREGVASTEGLPEAEAYMGLLKVAAFEEDISLSVLGSGKTISFDYGTAYDLIKFLRYAVSR